MTAPRLTPATGPLDALPPTAATLARALVNAGGVIPYRDQRVTTSGLTVLRHRGMVRVNAPGYQVPATIEWTDAGRDALARLDAQP